MKVVYKKTILEKIDDAIVEAKHKSKSIEKIVLTASEWYEYINIKGVHTVGKTHNSLFDYYKNVLVECVV